VHHHGGAKRFERSLKTDNGNHVEMIGRLVEEEDVGLGREHAGERRAPCLAA
jgi:hypothetical protein